MWFLRMMEKNEEKEETEKQEAGREESSSDFTENAGTEKNKGRQEGREEGRGETNEKRRERKALSIVPLAGSRNAQQNNYEEKRKNNFRSKCEGARNRILSSAIVRIARSAYSVLFW